ncbi:unnamed protein product [Staurois parvus]|uniref:Uncharacterized protein n=1 Tax=Staurois parvus TaxID=386267 RepID=A0ABN9BZ11_9NEOB|nr:unnamed protein product [Staurois parvus]
MISHVVSNDVRSDILLTTLHVITDWPISDHMIGTSYRGPVRRSVFHCARSVHKQGAGRPFINSHPTLHCHPPAVYIQRPDGRWLKRL